MGERNPWTSVGLGNKIILVSHPSKSIPSEKRPLPKQLCLKPHKPKTVFLPIFPKKIYQENQNDDLSELPVYVKALSNLEQPQSTK